MAGGIQQPASSTQTYWCVWACSFRRPRVQQAMPGQVVSAGNSSSSTTLPTAAGAAAEGAAPPAAARALVGLGRCSIKGRRPANEDAEVALHSLPGLPDHALLAVFDGHGGTTAAHLAERSFVSVLAACPGYRSYQDAADTIGLAGHAGHGAAAAAAARLLGVALREAFLELDAAVILPWVTHTPTKHGDESGCTAAVVVVTPAHLVCAWVGDSRACVCSVDGSGALAVAALSQDHKPTDPAETSRVEAAGGRVTAHGRICARQLHEAKGGGGGGGGGLAVSRALGDPAYKSEASLGAHQQMVIAEPEIRVAARAAGDLMVVVACDGVWDVMSPEVCCASLRELLALRGGTALSDAGATALSSDLCGAAFGRGSTDNISAVVGLLGGGGSGGNSAGVARTGGAGAGHAERTARDRLAAENFWRAEHMMMMTTTERRGGGDDTADHAPMQWSRFSATKAEAVLSQQGGGRAAAATVALLLELLPTSDQRGRFLRHVEKIQRVDTASMAKSCPWRSGGSPRLLAAQAFGQLLAREWSRGAEAESAEVAERGAFFAGLVEAMRASPSDAWINYFPRGGGMGAVKPAGAVDQLSTAPRKRWSWLSCCSGTVTDAG
eukprot:COSAG01_NODE_1068_length_11878_cov_45.012395_7_plen_611_part_00